MAQATAPILDSTLAEAKVVLKRPRLETMGRPFSVCYEKGPLLLGPFFFRLQRRSNRSPSEF